MSGIFGDREGRLGPPVEHEMIDYGEGGGGGYYPNYFYLIVNGEPDGTVPKEDAQAFFKLGSQTGSEHAFVFVDIGSDSRLINDLRRFNGGAKYVDDLRAACPALVMTEGPIQKLGHIPISAPVRITDFKQTLESIYDRMGVPSSKTKTTAIEFLDALNRYAHLKPNVFGVGVNLNEIISSMIAKLKEQPLPR